MKAMFAQLCAVAVVTGNTFLHKVYAQGCFPNRWSTPPIYSDYKGTIDLINQESLFSLNMGDCRNLPHGS